MGDYIHLTYLKSFWYVDMYHRIAPSENYPTLSWRLTHTLSAAYVLALQRANPPKYYAQHRLDQSSRRTVSALAFVWCRRCYCQLYAAAAKGSHGYQRYIYSVY